MKDPNEARNYIRLFSKHTLPDTNCIWTSTNRRIDFDNMTDGDAIFVANHLMKMETEAAQHTPKKKKILKLLNTNPPQSLRGRNEK